MMSNSDPRGRLVLSIHRRMLDSSSFILLGSSARIISIFPSSKSTILYKTDDQSDVFVTSINDDVTLRPIQTMLSNKTWALGEIRMSHPR